MMLLLAGVDYRVVNLHTRDIGFVARVFDDVAKQVVDLQLEPARGIVGRVVELDFAQKVVVPIVQQVLDLRIQGTGLVAKFVVD